MKKDSRVTNAKLDESLVRNIRYMLDAGKSSPKELARIYGMGVEQIRRIGRRESWAWVTDAPVPVGSPEETTAIQQSLAKLLTLQGKEVPPEITQVAAQPESASEKMARAVREAKEKSERGDRLLNELKGEGK